MTSWGKAKPWAAQATVVAPSGALGRRPRGLAWSWRWILALYAGAWLLPLPAQALDDVTQLSLEQLLNVKVVTASKYEQRQSEVGAAVSVITRNEIRAFGWHTLAEALASLPGVYLTYDRQYVYLGTRGFSIAGDFGARILVTINGNRVNDPVYDTGTFGQDFPLDMGLVERIEFIPGPGGAIYGSNAMLGVVNVVTRDGASLDGTEVAASYQAPQDTRAGGASWGHHGDDGTDIVLSISDLRSRGQDLFYTFGTTRIAGVATGMDGERDGRFHARLARGAWTAEYEHGNRRKDDPTASQLAEPLIPGAYQADRFDLAQVRYQDDAVDAGVNILARVFTGQYRYASVNLYATGPIAWLAYGGWGGAELRALMLNLGDHKPMAGVEIQDNYRLVQQAISVVYPAGNVTVEDANRRFGLYLQDEWQLQSQLLATLGLRLDHGGQAGGGVSPRVALIWNPADDTTIKALSGRAYRAPNDSECCYGDGVEQTANRALHGETIDTLELVADHRIGSDLSLRSSVYQWRLHDVITLGTSPQNGLSQYQSGPSARARGIELSSDRTWANSTRLRTSLAWQHTSFDVATPLPNSPQLLSKLHLSTALPGAALHLGYEWECDSRRGTEVGAGLGGYCLSNVYLSNDGLMPGLTVAIAVANALGKSYAQPAAPTNWQEALQQDGRSVRIDIGYRF